MLIRRAAISAEQIVDVRIDGELISEVGAQLTPQDNESVIDANGCALIPGLHDHHMHLLALAAAQQSLNCAAENQEQLAALLKERRHQRPDSIRGTGYHQGDEAMIDRQWLDGVCPDIPVRIQHRSGRLWILNSAAIAQIPVCANSFPEGAERTIDDDLSGRFFHMDDWLRQFLPAQLPDIAATSRRLAACGVTGITDAGPDNDGETARLLLAAQRRGELLQKVLLMGCAKLSAVDTPMLQRGAHKIYLKESAIPGFDELCAQIKHTHQQQRPVAFHCVTRVELQIALTALNEAGTHPGDRIEHASIADDGAIEQIKALGITVVTQPHFIRERGDAYRQQVEAEDIPYLYRAQSFINGGIPYAAGTDAPYGHYDPWRSMRAAVERKTPSGQAIGRDETLSPEQALALYTGYPEAPGGKARQIATGESADLCLLDCSWQTMFNDLDSRRVLLVWQRGETIYARTSTQPK